MTECSACTAPVVDAFLCSPCVGELSGLLGELVGWSVVRGDEEWVDPVRRGRKEAIDGLLIELDRTARSEQRLHDPVRRARRESPPLGHYLGQKSKDGDAHSLSTFPAFTEEDLDRLTLDRKALEKRETALLNKMLRAGKVNDYAAVLARSIKYGLWAWVAGKGGVARKNGRLGQFACDLALQKRTVINAMNPMQPPTDDDYAGWLFTHATHLDLARWLKSNVHLVALDEEPQHLLNTVRGHVHRIKRITERKETARFVGSCTTPVTDHRRCDEDAAKGRREPCHHREHECAHPLMAPRAAIEVQCQKCRTTHSVEKLFETWLRVADHKWFTIRELMDLVFPRLPKEERVGAQTIRDWAKQRKLEVKYKHSDRVIGWYRRSESDEMIVRLGDVRRLKLKSTQKAS